MDKEILKEEIIKKLEKSKVKLVLDKDLLESLLFEEVILNGKKYKKIVWQGDFLRKIDLSCINFDNVIWNGIDLSHTNANIDFSTSCDGIVENCNFSYVNLEKSNVSSLNCIVESDFSYSKADIRLYDKDGKENFSYFYKNNLCGLDLSKYCIFAKDLVNYKDEYLANCTFKNSKITINYDKFNDKMFSKVLGLMIKNGSLEGCFINDRYISPMSFRHAKRHDEFVKYFNHLLNLRNKVRERNIKLEEDK